MIITLSGASGSGKTTIAKELLKRLPKSSMVISNTTRRKRESDIPGEYRYNSNWWFLLLRKFGYFLWTIDLHEKKYGTGKWPVNKALKRADEYFLMILFDKVSDLLKYCYDRGSEDYVISFYVRSPPRDILRKRLQDRGDDDIQIQKRIKECAEWESKARNSDIPYIFINNDLSVDLAVNEIIDHINEIKMEMAPNSP